MHLSVFSEVRGFIMSATGLVLAPDCRESFRYEFFRGGSSEIPIVGGAIPDRGDIALYCFWVFIITEGSVDGFFPGECK